MLSAISLYHVFPPNSNFGQWTSRNDNQIKYYITVFEIKKVFKSEKNIDFIDLGKI
jgi:hypothetical protein